MPISEESLRAEPVAVYLVDDHAVVRRGIRSFLEMLDDISIVGEASAGEQALIDLEEMTRVGAAPDVALLDVILPGMSGLDLARELIRTGSSTRVVLLSSAGDGPQVLSAVQAGVNGYLLKSGAPEDVAEAIRAAARGETYLDRGLGGLMAQALVVDQQTPRLSAREIEVAALVAEGMSNSSIAAALFITERTARTHVSNILTKLDLASRTQLALWTVRNGLTTTD